MHKNGTYYNLLKLEKSGIIRPCIRSVREDFWA